MTSQSLDNLLKASYMAGVAAAGWLVGCWPRDGAGSVANQLVAEGQV